MREHGETETFSNPLPPEAHAHHQHDDDEHPLTNDDFRKLLMTPGGPQVSSSRSSSSKASSATEPHHSRTSSSSSRDHAGSEHGKEDAKEGEEDDAATRRRKKKSYYAKLKKLEDERQKELDQKYRDRARERRDGQNTDTGQTGDVSTTADYRAVAPDIKMGESYAERRKQIIQESKYLGGDMEHTHLVKGLDFALLEKVRAEITNKEIQDDQLEQYLNQNQVQQQQQKKQEKEEDPEMQIEFKSKLARNIYRVACKPRPHERNELFLPRRMAYVVDLEDEYADSDIPTTLIRSKADCATSESTTIMSTNDIVINKLTQILTYLRQGKRDRKKLKKDKGKREEEKSKAKLPGADESIYPEGHDIYPMLPPQKEQARVKREPKEERASASSRSREERDGRRGSGRDRERERSDRDRDRERRDRDRDRGRGGGGESHDERKRKSYFEKPADEDEEMKEPQRPQNARELVKTINDKFAGHPGWEEQRRDERKPVKREEERMKKIKKRMEIDSYAECYPGMEESADAVIDSDEEADYTKMDMGNKKGPVGRWDFENQDDYSNYMSTKEALPKAAFQYGVKMADGRKTRRAGPKDEKAQLDRQWQKIQNIIQKRKGEPEGKSGGKQARYH